MSTVSTVSAVSQQVDSPYVIDLHTHSLRSDGSDSPAALVEAAAAAGCEALALTDHDTVSGIAEAVGAAHRRGIELISGVELSCHTATRNIHLLGYFVDSTDTLFLERLESQQQLRNQRNAGLAARLDEMGLRVDLDEVEQIAGGESVGRPHFALAMVRRGYVSSIDEAFVRYLGDGGSAYVQRQELSAREAIDWITQAGGVASWAHPYPRGLYDFSSIEPVLEELVSYGLVGLEARYSRYDRDQRRRLVRLARKYELIATGGSDYHGTYKPDLAIAVGLGDLSVPYEVISQLRQQLPN